MCHIKEIICPCGELLLRTPGGGSGLKTCFKCGRMVHFDITESGVQVRLEDREALMARPGRQVKVPDRS